MIGLTPYLLKGAHTLRNARKTGSERAGFFAHCIPLSLLISYLLIYLTRLQGNCNLIRFKNDPFIFILHCIPTGKQRGSIHMDLSQMNVELFRFINDFGKEHSYLNSTFIFIAEYMVYILALLTVVFWFTRKQTHRIMVISAVASFMLAEILGKIAGLLHSNNQPFDMGRRSLSCGCCRRGADWRCFGRYCRLYDTSCVFHKEAVIGL